eukprot:jgi/Botrbrau1/21197/Bobra.0670s0002.1
MNMNINIIRPPVSQMAPWKLRAAHKPCEQSQFSDVIPFLYPLENDHEPNVEGHAKIDWKIPLVS